ncbi:MAG TPA: amidohydrolase, partial [Thermoanaerobaculia bacterium]|nr:amidohydrolase [Thermoanaerobaculia bacterium]
MATSLRSSTPLLLSLLAALPGLTGCASTAPAREPERPAARQAARQEAAAGESEPYPSTYRPLPSAPVLITNATVLTAAGDRIEGGSVLMRDGKIAAVGRGIAPAAGVTVVDASGKWVTPGIIDAHSHLGVYPAPGSAQAHQDGNEITDPVTAEVWAEHSVWPQDPQFPLAIAGGVTTQQILPGSANLIGGRSVVLKSVPARSVQAMKFPGAPHGLKMACGENPKRVYGGKGRAPSTRMGNMAGYREAFIEAREYARDWDEYEADKEGDADPP